MTFTERADTAAATLGIATERAFRRGYQQALCRARVRLVAGLTDDEFARWLDRVAEWRGVPFTQLLPAEPPPE